MNILYFYLSQVDNYIDANMVTGMSANNICASCSPHKVVWPLASLIKFSLKISKEMDLRYKDSEATGEVTTFSCAFKMNKKLRCLSFGLWLLHDHAGVTDFIFLC